MLANLQWRCSTVAATPRKCNYTCSKPERTNLKMAQASHGSGLSSGIAATTAALQVQHVHMLERTSVIAHVMSSLSVRGAVGGI